MKITERGQITIPKRLRRKYGLNERVEIEVVERGGQLVIAKAPAAASPAERIVGIVRMDESTDEYIAAIRGRKAPR